MLPGSSGVGVVVEDDELETCPAKKICSGETCLPTTDDHDISHAVHSLLTEYVGHKRLNAGLDLVADRANRFDALACRVIEFPVLVALSREEGACVATAHGDNHV